MRLTGTKVVAITGAHFTDNRGDYPSDPRQSTLYNWWLGQRGMLGRSKLLADEIDATLKKWIDLQSIVPGPETAAQLTAIQNNTAGLQGTITHALTVIDSKRIPVSLDRFDAWFVTLQKSQNVRWLVLEVGLPLVVGFIGICYSVAMIRNPVPVVAAPVANVACLPTPAASAPAQTLPVMPPRVEPAASSSPSATPRKKAKGQHAHS